MPLTLNHVCECGSFSALLCGIVWELVYICTGTFLFLFIYNRASEIEAKNGMKDNIIFLCLKAVILVSDI